jgi:hypothetical protein
LRFSAAGVGALARGIEVPSRSGREEAQPAPEAASREPAVLGDLVPHQGPRPGSPGRCPSELFDPEAQVELIGGSNTPIVTRRFRVAPSSAERTVSGRLTALVLVAVVAGAVIAGLLGAHRTSAHQPIRVHAGRIRPARVPPGAILMTVSRRTRGRAIEPGFLGLSLEYTAVEGYAGRDPKELNPVFLQLARNLTPDQAPVLRIGGDTTDWTWWPVPGVPKPGGIRYSLGPGFVHVTAALAHALGAKLILGINLEADSETIAAAEARALVRGIGRRSVEALELGNEPELYGSFAWYKTPAGGHVTGRPAGYDFTQFDGDFSRVSAALPNVPLAGPATGAPQWIPGLGSFLAGQPRVRVATLHQYPLKRCDMPAATAVYPSVARLLSRAASHGLADSVAPYVRLAHQRHVSLRIDELNSVSCGGAPGVSDVFASALWALDASFQMVRVGVDGVNIHTFPRATYGLFRFQRRHGRWHASVAPEYYGLLMFARAAPPDSHLLRWSGTLGRVHAWATRTSEGPVHIVLINESSVQTRPLAVRVAGARGLASLERLEAPSLTARTGVTLGGQSFGSATTSGLLAGRPQLSLLAPVSGDYVVKLPPASAAMLTLAQSPGRYGP